MANRTGHEVKDKWKNLTSTTKKRYSEIRRQEGKIGGGPPPKKVLPVEEKITELFEDTPLFTGLDGFETGAKKMAS